MPQNLWAIALARVRALDLDLSLKSTSALSRTRARQPPEKMKVTHRFGLALEHHPFALRGNADNEKWDYCDTASPADFCAKLTVKLPLILLSDP